MFTIVKETIVGLKYPPWRRAARLQSLFQPTVTRGRNRHVEVLAVIWSQVSTCQAARYIERSPTMIPRIRAASSWPFRGIIRGQAVTTLPHTRLDNIH